MATQNCVEDTDMALYSRLVKSMRDSPDVANEADVTYSFSRVCELRLRLSEVVAVIVV